MLILFFPDALFPLCLEYSIPRSVLKGVLENRIQKVSHFKIDYPQSNNYVQINDPIIKKVISNMIRCQKYPRVANNCKTKTQACMLTYHRASLEPK